MKLFRRNGTYVNFIRQNGIRLNGITRNGKTPQNLVGMNPPPPSPPTLSVYTLVYSIHEILILSEGVPVYGHLVEHIACIQQERHNCKCSITHTMPTDHYWPLCKHLTNVHVYHENHTVIGHLCEGHDRKHSVKLYWNSWLLCSQVLNIEMCTFKPNSGTFLLATFMPRVLLFGLKTALKIGTSWTR